MDDFSDEPESEAIATKALESAPNASRIQLIKKSGRQALSDFIRDGPEPFDFVFIDADKESKIHYYDTVGQRLVIHARAHLRRQHTGVLKPFVRACGLGVSMGVYASIGDAAKRWTPHAVVFESRDWRNR